MFAIDISISLQPYLTLDISIFSEFGTMINPKVYKPPPKFSFRNLKKYMPQIKEMARKEGVARDQIKKEKKEGAHMILQFLTDD